MRVCCYQGVGKATELSHVVPLLQAAKIESRLLLGWCSIGNNNSILRWQLLIIDL